MITVFVSLFFGASLLTSIALAAACMLSGRGQEECEAEQALVTVESLRGIAEVELPRRSQRRQATPAHVGI
ncbi:MAG: hypothetical protein U0X20_01210 [Caldilineaceae bacterium]